MKLIKWCLENQKEQWMLYTHNGMHWKQVSKLSVARRTYFYKALNSLRESIDFALIGLYLPYRNGIYAAMPHTQIIIQPEELYQFVSHFQQIPIEVLDEVAISIDRQLKEDQQEVDSFLTTFYHAQSIDEARAIYERWQMERSLWNELGNKLLLMMHVYEEEILNYFKYQLILKEFICLPKENIES